MKYPLSNEEEQQIFEEMLRRMGIPAIHSVQIANEEAVKTDIDVLAAYENLLIIVECCGKEKIGKKARLAESNFNWVSKNLEKLCKTVKENFGDFYRQTENIWRKIEKGQKVAIRKILFTTSRLQKQKPIKNHIYLIDFDEYSYFKQLNNLTFDHAKYEFFIFLNLKPDEIGDKITVKSPRVEGMIIEESKDKDIVVFKHSPSFLIRTTHVRRLYSWDKFGFQRLLKKHKINALVKFLKSKKESFPNNIIVATNISHIDYKPDYYKSKFEMKFNDFSYDIFVLIDGQHRLYAFAFNDAKIEKLREEVELLVTAIIFKDTNEEENYKKMAELFYTINTTYTKIDPETSIDLNERLYPNSEVAKANRLLKLLNNEEGTFLFNKIELSPYDEEYLDKKLLPRATLIAYSGLKGFFKETKSKSKSKSKSYKIFKYVHSNLGFDDFEESLFWIMKVYLKAVESSLTEVKGINVAKRLLEDTKLEEYYFMTVTVIGALFRLLRHFFSPDNPDENTKKLLKVISDKTIPLERKEDEVKQIIKELLSYVFQNVAFTLEEWKSKGWKSSQWALVEREMIDIIRKKYSNFGDEKLLKKSSKT